jgi:hypothetical protein
MEQPPRKLHDDEMDWATTAFETWSEELCPIQEKEEKMAYGGKALSDREIELKTEAQVNLEMCTPLLKSYQTFERHFGIIYASSGIRVHPRYQIESTGLSSK